MPVRGEPKLQEEMTSTLTLRFHFRVRITRITTRGLQKAKIPPIQIPIIIIGFLYQIFLGAETGSPSVFSLADLLVLLFLTGEE